MLFSKPIVLGVATNRDAWAYNFNLELLQEHSHIY